MIPRRYTIKYYFQGPQPVSLDDFVPVFHRWIQDRTVEGLLIDVADYKHIQNGPGVILVGDQVDYAIDLDGNRPGLLLRYKRRGPADGPLQAQLHQATLLALRGCRALETDPALQGKLTFRTGEVEIVFQDRLSAPNTAETFAEYSPDILRFLDQLYPENEHTLRRGSMDERDAFGVNVRIPGAPGLEDLIRNLETARVSL